MSAWDASVGFFANLQTITISFAVAPDPNVNINHIIYQAYFAGLIKLIMHKFGFVIVLLQIRRLST